MHCFYLYLCVRTEALAVVRAAEGGHSQNIRVSGSDQVSDGGRRCCKFRMGGSFIGERAGHSSVQSRIVIYI